MLTHNTQIKWMLIHLIFLFRNSEVMCNFSQSIFNKPLMLRTVNEKRFFIYCNFLSLGGHLLDIDIMATKPSVFWGAFLKALTRFFFTHTAQRLEGFWNRTVLLNFILRIIQISYLCNKYSKQRFFEDQFNNM